MCELESTSAVSLVLGNFHAKDSSTFKKIDNPMNDINEALGRGVQATDKITVGNSTVDDFPFCQWLFRLGLLGCGEVHANGRLL